MLNLWKNGNGNNKYNNLHRFTFFQVKFVEITKYDFKA